MIEIGIADLNDVPEIFAVERECFKSPWSEKMFVGDIENEHTVYLVARDKEQIVGYAGVWCVFGDADITNVAVSPKYRRQGIAGRLLERITEEARLRKCESIRLEVRESNFGAIALYKKHGFREIDIRKKYYDNTEDAVIMELILEEI